MKFIVVENSWGEVDMSLPETSTEELLACIHILYKLHQGDYVGVDRWLFSSHGDFGGDLPIDVISRGEGVIVLEFLRDVAHRAQDRMFGGGQ